MKIFMLYIIGRSGSGKSTIAYELENALKGYKTSNIQFIDGDIIRQQFGDIFGYSKEERMKCNRAVRVVVEYLLKNNISVVLTQVAAYEEMRKNVKEQFLEYYNEIYVDCSVEECVRRDVKGHYQKQKVGELLCLNGVDDVFEIPQTSDLVFDSEKESVQEVIDKILKFMEKKGYVI